MSAPSGIIWLHTPQPRLSRSPHTTVSAVQGPFYKWEEINMKWQEKLKITRAACATRLWAVMWRYRSIKLTWLKKCLSGVEIQVLRHKNDQHRTTVRYLTVLKSSNNSVICAPTWYGFSEMARAWLDVTFACTVWPAEHRALLYTTKRLKHLSHVGVRLLFSQHAHKQLPVF